MKWQYIAMIIGLILLSVTLFLIEFIIYNTIYLSFLIVITVALNIAHFLTHKFNWELDPKKVVPIYFILSTSLIIIEFSLTGSFLWSFTLTCMSLFFIGHYLTHAFNIIFKQFHIRGLYRGLISFYLTFVYFFILMYIFIQTTEHPFIIGEFVYLFYLSLIVMILLTVNSLIRIIAVAFHRRKYELFPINRVEYAALYYLKNTDSNSLNFLKLKEKIKGMFNIFIPDVYFDDHTAKSSIYYLCALGFSDIENDIVSLNEGGQQQEQLWTNSLIFQTKRYEKILNSNSILIKSFLGLFSLSLLKIFIGFFNSESLLAEGFENFLDCLAVILIGIGIRFKKEKLINIVLICLMGFTATSILINSIQSLIIGPEPVSNIIFIISIAIISIFLNTYLRILKNFIGKKNRNSSLIASAIDSKINIILSISIILGALLSSFGTAIEIPFFHYFDPIIAIFVCLLIFKEMIEIFIEIIASHDEEIEYEKFQMKYENNFREFIIKWILAVYFDNNDLEFTPKQLEKYFQNSLLKGEEVYTEFASFGLYLFKEKGIETIIKKLIKENLLSQSNEKILQITEKGKFLYKHFYSKELLEDLKDPFDFFFEQQISFDDIKTRKRELLENYNLR
ncbi:MAG: cation transporter [Candidatus Odinarchaeota archaeon]